jgi:hypothetical protein
MKYRSLSYECCSFQHSIGFQRQHTLMATLRVFESEHASRQIHRNLQHVITFMSLYRHCLLNEGKLSLHRCLNMGKRHEASCVELM